MAENVAPRLFAITLRCAIATGARLVVGPVGDGVIVAESEADSFFAATQPQQGEYVNETAFLTRRSELHSIVVTSYPYLLRALAVTTDGLLDLALARLPQQPDPPREYEPIPELAGGDRR